MESAKELCHGDGVGIIPVYQLAMPNGDHMLKVMMPDGYPMMIAISEPLPGVEILETEYTERDPLDTPSRSLGRAEATGQQLYGHAIQTDQSYCFYLNRRDELSLDVVTVRESQSLASPQSRFEVYPVIDSLDLETIAEEQGHLAGYGLEEVIAEARAIIQLSMRAAIQDEITALATTLDRCTIMVEDYQQFTEARDLATAKALASEEDYLTRCQLARRYDQGYQFAREVIEASRGIRHLDAKLAAIMNRL